MNPIGEPRRTSDRELRGEVLGPGTVAAVSVAEHRLQPQAVAGMEVLADPHVGESQQTWRAPHAETRCPQPAGGQPVALTTQRASAHPLREFAPAVGARKGEHTVHLKASGEPAITGTPSSPLKKRCV